MQSLGIFVPQTPLLNGTQGLKNRAPKTQLTTLHKHLLYAKLDSLDREE